MIKEKLKTLETNSERPLVRRVSRAIGAVAANMGPNAAYERRVKRIMTKSLERKNSSPDKRSRGNRVLGAVTKFAPFSLVHLSEVLQSRNLEQRKHK